MNRRDNIYMLIKNHTLYGTKGYRINGDKYMILPDEHKLLFVNTNANLNPYTSDRPSSQRDTIPTLNSISDQQ